MEIRPIIWRDDAVVLIDQNALPLQEREFLCREYGDVVAAITDLTVRGAPAIGIAAAFGIGLGMPRLGALPSPRACSSSKRSAALLRGAVPRRGISLGDRADGRRLRWTLAVWGGGVARRAAGRGRRSWKKMCGDRLGAVRALPAGGDAILTLQRGFVATGEERLG